MKVEKGYEALAEVLQLALEQSQAGKGKERHANNKPILQQPIMEIGRMVGPGYNIGQAMKKGQEAMRLPAHRAQAELLGAINYLAAAWLLIEETIPLEDRSRLAAYANVAASALGRQQFVPHSDEAQRPKETPQSPFTFPPALKFIGQGYGADAYLDKLNEEVREFMLEIGKGDYPAALVEGFDIVHVMESWLRDLCQRHGLDPALGMTEVYNKNARRQYYDAPRAIICSTCARRDNERLCSVYPIKEPACCGYEEAPHAG